MYRRLDISLLKIIESAVLGTANTYDRQLYQNLVNKLNLKACHLLPVAIYLMSY